VNPTIGRLAFAAIGLGLAVAGSSEAASLTNLSDIAASKAIVGKWVSSDRRPTGKPDTVCATDQTDWFRTPQGPAWLVRCGD
jgi:hypothetical protein